MRLFCLALLLATWACPSAGEEASGLTLVDFGADFRPAQTQLRNVEVNSTPEGRLRIASGHRIEWPGISFSPAGDSWDISGYRQVGLEVENSGPEPVSVGLRVDNPGADGSSHCVQVVEAFEPGEKRLLAAELSATSWALDPPLQLVGMRGTPGQLKIDPTQIVQLIVFVPQPQEEHVFTIGPIRAEGRLERIDSSTFFPFIDQFGQFAHRDWPGKIRVAEDLQGRRQAEEDDLAAWPGPADRNQYGGWLAGPQLKATGFFRVQKYRGKWWLVDPEGRLFWSHGVDCVAFGNETGTTDREHYFRGLPEAGDPLALFYSQGWWAPRGYYKGRTPFTTFNHQRANLYRKYGEEWAQAAADRAHRRLRSWGMNTVANWSSPAVYLQRRTPYVATVHFNAPSLEGSQGYWRKFHDVFDPGFRIAVRRALAAKEEETGDPWCIGFFVDNELAWGDEVSLALAALASPAGQAAKRALVADLQARYGAVGDLNVAWGTDYASWVGLLESQEPPATEGREGLQADLRAFYRRTAETYFATVKEELAALAPQQLYLGCRFAWVNELAAGAAARFCDVVSYNKYAYSVEALHLPAGLDRPVIIGEFHFGALDRGLFHTGLQAARDQQHRAALYRDYLRGALDHPLLVGAHWFQYGDQSTTGRGDGENYQIGFVDIGDTPYPEIVGASRKFAAQLYERRAR
ncbi:MAG: beta-agarase [Candidatus Latescibacteria bacterium]|nr:beta-agarase [Candidatus Latescibacterota bacterium]